LKWRNGKRKGCEQSDKNSGQIPENLDLRGKETGRWEKKPDQEKWWLLPKRKL